MFVVTVTFEIEPIHFLSFVEALKPHALTSLNSEQHLLQFDVSISGNSREVFIYEVYTSVEGYDLHLSSPHFDEFTSETNPWVLNKIVNTYTQVRLS